MPCEKLEVVDSGETSFDSGLSFQVSSIDPSDSVHWTEVGARGGTRTLMPFGMRPLNARVCHSTTRAREGHHMDGSPMIKRFHEKCCCLLNPPVAS